MKSFVASPWASKTWRSAAIVLGLAIPLAGCESLPSFGLGDEPTEITSKPANVFIKVDGENLGNTPLTYMFDFDEASSYEVTAEKEGYKTLPVTIRKDDYRLKEGELRLVLQEDPAWYVTTNSDATNRWLRLQIDPSIDQANSWQKIVDAVTTAYDSLEQLDYQSGYIRSVRQVQEFKGGSDPDFFIRTQFLGSISSRTPLTYKFKIRAEKRLKFPRNAIWKPFDRVFKNDADLVEELQARLGIK